MEHYEERTYTTQVVVRRTCDRCDTILTDDPNEIKKFLVEAESGWNSPSGGSCEHTKADLCEDCFGIVKKVLEAIDVKFQIYEVDF